MTEPADNIRPLYDPRTSTLLNRITTVVQRMERDAERLRNGTESSHPQEVIERLCRDTIRMIELSQQLNFEMGRNAQLLDEIRAENLRLQGIARY